ncbi:hypothetical protein ACSHWB_25635 [Lentzea sp. HUAS TT2]|uniref:hypothetical protein n=1 Tax=Lentzea sp. HUAS TT2 TaxID=3447454 RepID=UPI003F6F3D28
MRDRLGAAQRRVTAAALIARPFDTLTTALGGALGMTRREDVEAVVNARLNGWP